MKKCWVALLTTIGLTAVGKIKARPPNSELTKCTTMNKKIIVVASSPNRSKPHVICGAILSECGTYRYQLWRIWDATKPLVLWIMHNPSTADASKDDPTIRRVIGFTKEWGYGGIYVGNLFPFRATDPKELLNKSFEEIAPLENFKHTNEMKMKCGLYVLAYGNPIVKDAAPEMFDADWMALKLTKSGNPCHPLYLKSDLKPSLIEVLRHLHRPDFG